MTKRINYPPIPKGKKKAYVPSDLQKAVRDSIQEGIDPTAEHLILMYALAHQGEDGWVDLPYRHLAQDIYHMRHTRLAKAIKRLVKKGIVEEHPDNFRYRQRVAKRIRIIVNNDKERDRKPKTETPKEETEKLVFETPSGKLVV